MSILVPLSQSVGTLLMGYFPAVIIGAVLGGIIGIHPLLCQIGKRLLQFPVAAPVIYVPVFLQTTQHNLTAAVLCTLFSSIWFIAIHTGIGLQKALRRGYQWHLAIPRIFLGLRLGLTVAWSATIICEFVMSGISGIGFEIWNAYQNADYRGVSRGVIAIMLVTFLSDQLLDVLGIALQKVLKPAQPS
jgi:bicarbonate transport system permease protein